MKVVIIDDEQNSRESLRLLITQFFTEITIVGEANTAASGKTLVDAEKPALVFLDVEMPGGSGFTFLKNFENPPFEVIFTTAHQQYAIKALRERAVDFLVKPYDLDDLQAAIDRLQGKTEATPPVETDRVALPVGNGLQLVAIPELAYCEAAGSYAYLYPASGERFLVAKTLKYLEERFQSHSFCRVHDAFLVNLDFVDRYVHGRESKLVLKSGIEVPVSRGRKKNVLSRLKPL